MSLPKHSKNKIRRLEPLGPRTTFKIGGNARVWYEPKDKLELASLLKNNDLALPLFVIGAGSNILVKEGTINRAFIHLRGPDFCKINISGTRVEVGAGVRMGSLISALDAKNLGGYEFLAGIPGAIGGALVMNAGARNDHRHAGSCRHMSDIVSSVEALDAEGRSVNFKKDDIDFFYRGSSLKPYIIVSAFLDLYRDDKKAVGERIKNNIAERIRCQDWHYPSAGSFFKNPPGGEPAGRLIDLCGLKGFKVGGAQVSRKHANFIVNSGGATSSDVLNLMEIIKERVYNRFKIILEPEVEVVS